MELLIGNLNLHYHIIQNHIICKTSFTLTKGETKNFGSYNTGVATRIGTQLMQISTNNSYSDTTYFWGTWTYDL